MGPVSGLLVLAIFPVIFTAWGWRYVVVPVLWPTIKAGAKLTMVLVWIGFGVGVMGTGWFYRTFGLSLVSVVAAVAPTPKDGQTTRWQWDNAVTPEGGWEPGWRERRGMPTLPADWDGPVEHKLPEATLLILAAALYAGFRLIRSSNQRRLDGPISNNMQRRMRILRPAPTLVPASPVDGWTDLEREEFTSALRHLGFSKRIIKEVGRRVDGDTIEERIKQALRYLTKENKV